MENDEHLDTIETLDASGHLSFKWDPDSEEDVARARLEVKRLKAMGYVFYAVVNSEQSGDEVAVGNGQLIVQYTADPLPPEREPEPSPEEDLRSKTPTMSLEDARKAPEPVDAPDAGSEAAEGKKARRKGKRTVAMRPLAGG